MCMNTDEIWNIFLSKVYSKVSIMTYNYIFKDLKLYSYTPGNIVIVVPSNELLLQNIKKNYQVIIEDILNDITNDICEIQYVFANDVEKLKPKIEKKQIEISNNFDDNLEND